MSSILSFTLGLIGIYCGFYAAEGFAESLTGFSYIFCFIPVLLISCALFGALGFAIGRAIER